MGMRGLMLIWCFGAGRRSPLPPHDRRVLRIIPSRRREGSLCHQKVPLERQLVEAVRAVQWHNAHPDPRRQSRQDVYQEYGREVRADGQGTFAGRKGSKREADIDGDAGYVSADEGR